jgi:mannose-1-phosphate guanylyltransferase
MQALVLAGGEGTRLRPLTLTVPKPVMPLAGRPFLSFMIDWLHGHGVDDVVLACGFLAEAVQAVLGDAHGDVRLRYVVEDEPLGTAGPARLAADLGLLEDRLLVLNGDVLTDIDLTAQLALHERAGATATLALVAVEDTASYGVVPTFEDGRVEAFLEKSTGPVPTDRINAGAYVVERAAIDAIPAGRPVSFEREVFPRLADEGTLYGHASEGYWIDIGTPERYLEATHDLLSGRVESTLPERDAGGSLLYEGVDAAATEIGPLSVLGPGCSVGAGSKIERAVLHSGVQVGAGCVVRGSVLADEVVLEDGARVEGGAMLGRGARVAAGERVEAGARVPPGATA